MNVISDDSEIVQRGDPNRAGRVEHHFIYLGTQYRGRQHDIFVRSYSDAIGRRGRDMPAGLNGYVGLCLRKDVVSCVQAPVLERACLHGLMNRARIACGREVQPPCEVKNCALAPKRQGIDSSNRRVLGGNVGNLSAELYPGGRAGCDFPSVHVPVSIHCQRRSLGVNVCSVELKIGRAANICVNIFIDRDG